MDDTPGPEAAGRDWPKLVALVLAVVALRGWLIAHTEVTARDSIGYIRYAYQLDRDPWAQVLQANLQHPGYPLTVLAVSYPVRAFSSLPEAGLMQLSAQLATALASVLLVFPMYYLGKELFDRRVAFWAALLFQCFPVSGRILADGLSEGLFLLCTATALYWSVRALRGERIYPFVLCGVSSGLAYLTRPEGALTVLATALVLLGKQAHPRWRMSWNRLVGQGAALGISAALLAAPYVMTTHRLTNKPTAQTLMQTASARGGSTPLGSLFAVWSLESQKGSLSWGFQAVCVEVVKGFFYLSWLPALVALWLIRQRFREGPELWVPVVLAGLHALLLWRLAAVMGYVSERHALLIVLCGIYFSAKGLLGLGDLLAQAVSYPRAGVGLALATALLASVASLKPLHANRAGHHAAGLWLAQHSHPADPIVDPFCWAHYYAGRVFWEGLTPPTPPGFLQTQYVVLETPGAEDAVKKQRYLPWILPRWSLARADNHDHVRLPQLTEAMQLASRGKISYHWPDREPIEKARIVVYAVGP